MKEEEEKYYLLEDGTSCFYIDRVSLWEGEDPELYYWKVRATGTLEEVREAYRKLTGDSLENCILLEL